METYGPIIDGVLTEQLLKSASNEFDVESIHTISLSKLGLVEISAIGENFFWQYFCSNIILT